MIEFDPATKQMILPDGRRFDISSTIGAELFLQSVSNFDFFSSKVIEMRDRRRLCNAVLELTSAAFHLGMNVGTELFAEKIPLSEIACWLQFATVQVEQLATDNGFWNTEFATKVLGQCALMFVRTLPVALGFKSIFFEALAKFGKARKEFCRESFAFGSVVWQAFDTFTSRSNNEPKSVFKHLDETGILEQCLPCLILAPIPDGVYKHFIDGMLEKLQRCPSFLIETFKSGDPCGDLLRILLQEKADTRHTREYIFQRLENIVLSVDSMEMRSCHGCCKSDKSKAYQEQLMICGQCRMVCYCSRDCQVADRKRHKKFCSEVPWDTLSFWNPLTSRLDNFLNSHYETMMLKMDQECKKTGLNAKDMIVDLDFEPGNEGIIPALQNPPIFKIRSIGDCLDVSEEARKAIKSNQRPDQVTFFLRFEDAKVRCINVTL